jgi:hypothetical protein
LALPIPTPSLGLPPPEPALLLWSLLAAVAALRFPADAAGLSLPENPGSRPGLKWMQGLLLHYYCPADAVVFFAEAQQG